MFPGLLKFEKGFAETDKLWESNRKESKHMRNIRVARLLNDIFKENYNDEKTVINLITHKGVIKSILHVVNHEKIDIQPGEMFMVIIKRVEFGKVKYSAKADWIYFKEICPEYPKNLPSQDESIYETD
ncbi:unnamed protein product [Candida verbasci]|uniref:Uncharacterized protein n=1 Tax=Candida verbasci TaxID=1227364 RepID=A0A9W4XJP6_9ASCO|nr:unnamed protein product [Candida verbasci]